MKKAAVLSITAFYLLIISGLFACTVHCAAAKVIVNNKGSMCCTQHIPISSGTKSCCSGHINYIVKENLVPGTDFTFSEPVSFVSPLVFYHSFFPLRTKRVILPVNNNDQPWPGGRSIITRFHSLMI